MENMDLSKLTFYIMSYGYWHNYLHSCRAAFNPDELRTLETEEKKPTVLKLVQQWLERTPGLEEEGFNFPLQYKNAVEKLLQVQKDSIKVHREDIRNQDTSLNCSFCRGKQMEMKGKKQNY